MHVISVGGFIYSLALIPRRKQLRFFPFFTMEKEITNKRISSKLYNDRISQFLTARIPNSWAVYTIHTQSFIGILEF